MADLSRLKAQLLTSGLQKKDNALFQVINQLIDAVNSNTDSIDTSTSSGGSSPAGSGQTYLTLASELATLPNSRQVLAGSGIQFLDTVGRRIISSALPYGMGDSSGGEGDDGSPGPPGMAGNPGPMGPQGASASPGISFVPIDGQDGDDGLPGLQGPQGFTGPAGSIGPQGPIGNSFIPSDGEDGIDGFPVIGPQGFTGNPGAQGNQGQYTVNNDGEDGIDGFPMSGPQGFTGSQGPIGITGPMGIWSIEPGEDGEPGFPVPGPAGPSASSISNIGVSSITLSASQINTASSVPISMAVAPGTNNVNVVVFGIMEFIRTTNVFSNDPSFRVRYTGIATDLLAFGSFNINSSGAGNRFKTILPVAFDFGFGGSDPRNIELQFSASVDTTGGSGASLKVTIFYYITNW